MADIVFMMLQLGLNFFKDLTKKRTEVIKVIIVLCCHACRVNRIYNKLKLRNVIFLHSSNHQTIDYTEIHFAGQNTLIEVT